MPPRHLLQCFPRILTPQIRSNPRIQQASRFYRATSALYRKPETTPSAGTANSPSDSPAETLSDYNVFASVAAPASAIETIYPDGFLFSNGVGFRDGSGVLLVHNEAFKWRPTEMGSPVEHTAMKEGILKLGSDVWGMLDVVHPKPELLIVGTGNRTLLLSKEDRDRITQLGIRMDVMDTGHAAAQYNLLATERQRGEIAAAMLVTDFGGV